MVFYIFKLFILNMILQIFGIPRIIINDYIDVK